MAKSGKLESNSDRYGRDNPDRWAPKGIAEYLDNEPFCFTYGDGVSDLILEKALNFIGAMVAKPQ